MAEKKYYGHATRTDGTHKLLSKGEADALWNSVLHEQKVREVSMPKTEDALSIMFKARQRLQDLGWRSGVHCPKDGTPFAAIQYGSTAICTGSMTEEWPYGFAMIEDGGTHPYGFMWKPIEDLTEDENAARIKTGEETTAYTERMFKAFAAMDAAERTDGGGSDG